VVTVTDEFQHAIANSGDDQLANAAASLATIEEFAGTEPEATRRAARRTGGPCPPRHRGEHAPLLLDEPVNGAI